MKSKRTRTGQQALLKLDGQKIFKISDSGGLLSDLGGLSIAARLTEETGLLKMAAACIDEWRDPEQVKYEIEELLGQRLFLVAGGKSDAIDCSINKKDPALVAVLRQEPGSSALASQSTHTRMEQGISSESIGKLEDMPLQFFFSQQKHAPQRLTVYVDGLAVRTYGSQQKSIYRGGRKYSQMQYFPIIATTETGWLLCNKLRPGSAADGKAVPIIQELALNIKQRWQATKLTMVMDTGFNSPELLDFFDAEKIEFECGYPYTSSIGLKIPDVLKEAEVEFRQVYGEPLYTGRDADELWQKEHERIRGLPAKERMEAEQAMRNRYVRKIVEIMHNGKGWDEDRRLIVRVDFSDKGLDVRCVVTNKRHGLPESIYETDYCQRSRIETFIKENKSHCRVPLSCQEFTANQFRLAMQGLAYQLLHLMRLELPQKQQAISIATVRRTLLTVPVLIEVTARRVHWRLSSVHPCTRNVIHMAKKLQRRRA